MNRTATGGQSAGTEAGRAGPAPRASLGVAQTVTVALLFAGYAACYFCRADLAVATPLLIDELGALGVSHADAIVRIGRIASLGVLAYAAGKLLLTGLGDYWGGRRNFLIGLGGAAAFTLLFAAGGALPVFTLAWIGNRLTQSIAWAGLIKVCSRWFDFSSYGAIVGVLSISYLVGDAAARAWMGALLRDGAGWRTLFVLAACAAGALFIANLLWLRESRTQAGYEPARANPMSVYEDARDRPAGIAQLFLPLLRSRAFLLVCLLSLACTVVRETFNLWTPVYLHDTFGFAAGDAALASAVFPALGAVSVVFTGWLSDRLGAQSRAAILSAGLSATALSLLTLALLSPQGAGTALPLALIGGTAFCLLGPYSFLGGAMALDFGGRQGGAAASGIIDGVGYLGSALAGDTVARISVAWGWNGVFTSLTTICGLAAVVAAFLFRLERRARAGVEQSR